MTLEQQRQLGRAPSWVADVRGALAIWRRTPVLPVIGGVLALVVALPQLVYPAPANCGIGTHPPCTSGSRGLYILLSVLGLPAALYGIGFLGAERWWYAQVANGRVPHGADLWRGGWKYFWRFVRLALLVALLSAPVVTPFALSVRHDDTRLSLVFGVWGFALDIALTFVTPALALSTDSAWSALKIGVKALDNLWPRNALYVLIPPMALTIVTRFVPEAFGSRAVTALAGALAQLLTMLFAGATVLLYIRDVDPDAADRRHHGPAG